MEVEGIVIGLRQFMQLRKEEAVQYHSCQHGLMHENPIGRVGKEAFEIWMAAKAQKQLTPT